MGEGESTNENYAHVVSGCFTPHTPVHSAVLAGGTWITAVSQKLQWICINACSSSFWFPWWVPQADFVKK
jgi:hypothetical protein